jgi:hypothetical protein
VPGPPGGCRDAQWEYDEPVRALIVNCTLKASPDALTEHERDAGFAELVRDLAVATKYVER